MATHRGFVSASKDVVLEIQVNKLINDFLFSGVEKHNAADLGNAGGGEASRCMISNHTDASWEMNKASCIPLEHLNLTKSMDKIAGFSSVADISGTTTANASSKVCDGSKCVPLIRNKGAGLPTSEEVWLDIPEQKASSCSDDRPLHTNKLKVFRLSRVHSDAGSLFCFAMERREQEGSKTEEASIIKSENGRIKLTRIGSLPCNGELHRETEKEVKHTCRKPPRPPRSSSMKDPCSLFTKHASADAIFVLHSASRRARLERRKKHTASSSSNASIWALIFTFCFAMAMIGEGFWSQSSSSWVVDASRNATEAQGHMNSNSLPSSLTTIPHSNLHVLNQFEKEMQMREFWISKGLDPS